MVKLNGQEKVLVSEIATNCQSNPRGKLFSISTVAKGSCEYEL